VCGSAPVLPKGSWHVRPGDVDVVVGAPVRVTGRTREELMAQVEAFFLEHMAAETPLDVHREAV